MNPFNPNTNAGMLADRAYLLFILCFRLLIKGPFALIFRQQEFANYQDRIMGESIQNDTMPCHNCGRVIATTTRVCPRCEHRTRQAGSN